LFYDENQRPKVVPNPAKKFLLPLLLNLWLAGPTLAQDCPAPPKATPSTQPGTINWRQFPEFSLPFTTIYGGPRLGDSERLPLRRGFSHLATFAGNDNAALPPNQRALLWYGLAFGTIQPWSEIESPFANDLGVFREKWRRELRDLANLFDDSRGRDVPNVDILNPDIERDIVTDRSILALKTDPRVPAPLRQFDDATFITRYQREMQKLYAEPLKFTRESGFSGKLCTYGDAPIRNTFINVDGNSWQDWTTNPARLNYLFRDSLTNATGGPFYQALSLLTPSAYYCYDYPNSLSGNYLSYLLFQIEANVARSPKDVVPFLWLHYTDACGNINRPIRAWMAEATAIFPFFSGAKGFWLWENPVRFGELAGANLSVYEHFVNGLYRLSQFRDFFEGNYQLYLPKPARDHFADRDAVWRGVVKGNRILVAAQNPYADDGRTTTLPIRFGDWQTTISLTGTDVFLCAFTLPEGTGSRSLSVFPNPVQTTFTARYTSAFAVSGTVQLFDRTGRLLREQPVQSAQPATLDSAMSVRGLPAGLYLVRVVDGGTVLSQKLVVN
jgi:hypothetical protein